MRASPLRLILRRAQERGLRLFGVDGDGPCDPAALLDASSARIVQTPGCRGLTTRLELGDDDVRGVWMPDEESTAWRLLLLEALVVYGKAAITSASVTVDPAADSTTAPGPSSISCWNPGFVVP